MMRRAFRLVRLFRFAAVLLVVPCVPVPAAAGESYALGLGIDAGWGVVAQKWENAAMGGLLGGTLSLESPYFLAPVLGIHHAWLAESEGTVALDESGERVAVSSALRAFAFLLGAAVELGPVRLLPSIGLFHLTVESTVDGVAIDPSSLAFGYAVEIDAWAFQGEWATVGLYVMAYFLAEAQLAYFGSGVTTRFDIGFS